VNKDEYNVPVLSVMVMLKVLYVLTSS